MNIDPELHERVFELATAITNVLEDELSSEFETLYRELEAECENAHNSDKAHPFFLETLGDFTLDDEGSLTIYQQALELADRYEMLEYSASINFAMAERYRDLGEFAHAYEHASKAIASSEQVKDDELKREIGEFVDHLRNAT